MMFSVSFKNILETIAGGISTSIWMFFMVNEDWSILFQCFFIQRGFDIFVAIVIYTTEQQLNCAAKK